MQPIPELKRPTPEEFRSGARRRQALSRLIPAAAAARVTLPVTDKARMNIAARAIVQPSRRMRRWLVRESLWCIDHPSNTLPPGQCWFEEFDQAKSK